MRIKERISPQYRIKRKLNRFIQNKQNKGIKGLYYTYLRDVLAIKYGVEIGVNTSIDGPVDFPHPRNIVIGENAIIGKKLTIYNNVTIGQNHGDYPKIGDNVTIYPGSVIVGKIIVGDNVIIGANSFVNKDIENDSVVAGNPARIIRRRTDK